MQQQSANLAKQLLQDEAQHSGRFGRKALALSAMLVGLGLVALLGANQGGVMSQETALAMPVGTQLMKPGRLWQALQPASSGGAPCRREFLQPLAALGKKTKCIHPGKSPKCGDCPDNRGRTAPLPAKSAATANQVTAYAMMDFVDDEDHMVSYIMNVPAEKPIAEDTDRK
eukprot:gnl/TRDRNA2_/TRDRNA2_182860_c0_seq1.p2 gnl/TRDRNA2_/TRDRNA2_182860_c0~~gnl/TRDRNA2_/TRDRNA2_182860_c0_seq1.p2  ORF type:complete len:171 (+),score=43.22 gnl/TRDRNA2_/TRDRNA2_182860_c0_seq1:58-570(+)